MRFTENETEPRLKDKIKNLQVNKSKDFDHLNIFPLIQNNNPIKNDQNLTKSKEINTESEFLESDISNNNRVISEQNEKNLNLTSSFHSNESPKNDEKESEEKESKSKHLRSEFNKSYKSFTKIEKYSDSKSIRIIKGIQKTLYSVISNFYNSKKFISLLRDSTIYRRPKWLKENHYKMINDWSFFEEGWLTKKTDLNEEINSNKKKNSNFLFQLKFTKFLIFLNFLKKIEIKVFDPTKTFRLIWDILHFLMIVIFLIIIPIQLSFDIDIFVNYNEINPILFKFIEIFSQCFFICDFIVNLNTAYYDKGSLIFKRRMIFKNYMKISMFSDLLSILPLILHMIGNEIRIINLCFLLRIFNLRQIFIRVQEYFLIDEKLQSYISLLKLILGIFLLSHLFACLWHYIGWVIKDNQTTWLVYYNLVNEKWWTRYLNSYYYVVITMNTVGYGDLVPQTGLEKLYVIIFIYFACWNFAYTINSVGMIIQESNKANREYSRNINLINGYLKKKKINFDLRMRIKKYIEFIWQEKSNHNEEDTSVLINKLSKSLKEELLKEANGVILRDLPVFNLNFSEESLHKTVCLMKEVSFIPGEIIYPINDIEDKSLYILRSGEVELFIETPRSVNDSETIVTKIVKKGEFFGEYSFFTDKERETFARCSTFTSLFIIKREDFLSILKNNQIDFESFCSIKDQLILYQKFDFLYTQCSSCKESKHSTLDCPLLHLFISKQRIILKYNYSEDNRRKSFDRFRKKKKYNALSNFENHENLAEKIQQHQILEHNDESSIISSNSSSHLNFKKNESIDSPIEQISLKDTLQLDSFNKSSMNLIIPKENPMIASKNLMNTNLSTSVISPKKCNSSSFVDGSIVPSLNTIYSKKPETSIKFTETKEEDISSNEKSKKQSGLFDEDYSAFDEGFNINNINQYPKEREKEKRKEKKENSLVSKTIDESKENLGILKKLEQESRTEKLMTMTTEIEKNLLDDIAKSYEYYFPHNNVENVIEKINENKLKKKKKRASKYVSKIFTNLTYEMGERTNSKISSPTFSNKKKSQINRSNFFTKKDDKRASMSKNSNSKRRSILNKAKIIEFLKEEEKKKMVSQSAWNKMLGFFSKNNDENILSKYSIKSIKNARKDNKKI